jgi:hypothetical protein
LRNASPLILVLPGKVRSSKQIFLWWPRRLERGETDTVPKSCLANGAIRLPVEHGGAEPLGNRIA